jgi:hypothetical protein
MSWIEVRYWSPGACRRALGNGESCEHPDHEAIGQKSNVSNWKKHTGETQYLFGIRWNTTAGFHYGPGLVMAQGLISLP